MLPGGKFEFDIDNFSGQSTTIRIYGCDGVNRGFEFDGETLVPITTGASSDTPTHVRVHKLQLFFSFGSSVIHSGVGTPFKWSAVDGASELACGDVVTNLMNQPGSTTSAALGITTRTNTLILYGTSIANWNLVPINNGVGGIPYTGQLMTESYWMAAQGVIDMRATLSYGNFRQATISTDIQDYIVSKRGSVAYSVLNRTTNQYRVLFDDGAFLMFTIINGKLAGVTKGMYFHPMFCAWSSDMVTLNERVFCGAANDGYVYLMDTGSSFDGEAIEAFLVFNWNAMRSPRIKKRYRRTSIEMQGNFYAAFEFGYSLGYSAPYIIQPPSASYTSTFTGAPAWDDFVWDAFVWDGVTLGPSELRTTGRAENIQVSLRCGTNYIQPFVVNSLVFHYSMGRGLR
jgi:chloramphenicol 3-O-phosphotransferase